MLVPILPVCYANAMPDQSMTRKDSKYLLGHVHERLRQVLLAEGKLAGSPDLGVRLQVLLELGIQAATLEGNDLGSGIGVVSNGRAAFLAEPTPDGIPGVGSALPLLDGSIHFKLVLGNHNYKGVGRARLTLAIITVVIASEERGVNVDLVGDGFAKAVSGERHVELYIWSSEDIQVKDKVTSQAKFDETGCCEMKDGEQVKQRGDDQRL